jgi:hypothetical protein
MAKGKRAGGGRKTKAKKDEPIEVSITADPELGDEHSEIKVEKTKHTRGKKRTSDTIDESSSAITSQQQPAKRRATRATRGSVITGDDSCVSPSIENDNDTDMTALESIIPEKKTINRKKGRGSTTKSKRNFSSASAASKASLRMCIPDDDEIERALQADLERPLTDEEDNTSVSRPEKPADAASIAPIRKTTRAGKAPNVDHVMFGVGETAMDEAAIEAELEAMEVEESMPLPKAKGAKGKQGRKPSAKQQAAAKRAADAAQAEAEAKTAAEAQDSRDDLSVLSPQVSKVENTSSRANTRKPSTRGTRASVASVNMSNASLISVGQPSIDIHSDSGNESDASMASQATIVRTSPKRRGSALKNAKGGKKAMARHIEEIVSKPTNGVPNEQVLVEKPQKKRSGRPKKAIHAEETVVAEDVTYAPPPSPQKHAVEETTVEPTKVKLTGSKGKDKALPELPIAPHAKLARQTTPPPPKELTPSLSPQSSDAENHPPSKPSTAKSLTQSQAVRIPLATSTPIASPSRRNVVAGLQTTNPWTAVDLDEIFLKSPSEKENANQETTVLLAMALGKAKMRGLTSPERKMTVGEWIIFNAGLAEEKLRGECERMVGVFEGEGGRAMRVLEGVECVE